MTVRGEDAAQRQIARKALAHRMGSAAGARAVAEAAQRAYDDLVLVSIPLIGQVGSDALTGRALYLAQRKYPWLVDTREPNNWVGPFAQIIFCLERQTPSVATEAAETVFALLAGLLVTFIGEPLTARLLQDAWPDAFTDARTEETEA